MPRTSPYRLGLAVMSLVLAACSSSGRSSPEPGLTEAWSVSSIAPIGQPVTVGDTAVVYGTAGEELVLYGVAVADGTIRWQQRASPSAVAPGMEVAPRVIDDRVAYFRPDASEALVARLVVAAPDTGRDLFVSEPTVFRSHPAPCSDDKDICVVALDGPGPSSSRRFSVEAGVAVPDPGAPPAGSRYVGDNLLDLGERHPEVLAGFDNGVVRWRTPLSRYFSPTASTDRGWHFVFYESAGLRVSTVYRPPAREDSTEAVTDLSHVQTAAIDAATGGAGWTSEGTDFACGSKLVLDRTVGDGKYDPWPVRCRSRGIARYDRATKAVTYQGLEVTVEGFDVPTGNTTWSAPLGAAHAFLDDDRSPSAVSDSEMLVEAATGHLIIDLANGATRQPAPAARFWCAKPVTFDYLEAFFVNGQSTNEWRGGTRFDPCSADGSSSTFLSRQLPKSLGATVGDRTVLATSRGLVGYDRRPN